MDLWRWEHFPSDLPNSTGSSTSVNALSDRQQLAVTYHPLHWKLDIIPLEHVSETIFDDNP